MNIKGQAAIVTGGASGLGALTAKRLAAAGAKVAILDMNFSLAQKIAEEIGGIAVECNVADEASAAREFAQFGIRVNAIAPGLFLTPLLEGLSDEAKQSLSAAIPFPKRLGAADEYAKLVLHIVDNSYINGEVIRIDGTLGMQSK